MKRIVCSAEVRAKSRQRDGTASSHAATFWERVHHWERVSPHPAECLKMAQLPAPFLLRNPHIKAPASPAVTALPVPTSGGAATCDTEADG